jgi:hypothetical protein
MNKFWTYLNRGATNEFGRGITEDIYHANADMKDLHNLLVPVSELSYSCLCTEQILQAVLNSSFKGQLESSDTLNTYSRSIPASPPTTYSITQSYPGIDIYLLDEYADKWAKATFAISLNSTLSKASISSTLGPATVIDFSITDSMSSKIPLSKGFYLRFRGTLPAEPVNISTTATMEFRRNLTSVLADLDKTPIVWVDKACRDIFKGSKIPLERVAAAAMNLYTGLNHG